jgi:uncharacterized protein YjbI with pentapeptide repeats
MQSSDLVNDAERRVWDAFAHGRDVDLGEGDPTADGFDPATWAQRAVRGELITQLLLGAQPDERGYVAKVSLSGAWITGDLVLDAGQTRYELNLRRCYVQERIDFNDSELAGVFFEGCNLSEVWLERAHVRTLRLDGCHVGRQVETALAAAMLKADHGVSCVELRAVGEVTLDGATIGGDLDLRGATLTGGAAGRALSGYGITVNQAVYCSDGLTATGEFALMGSHIGHELNLTGARLTNPDGAALFADSLTVGHFLICASAVIDGQLSLAGARIGTWLSFRGARLSSRSDWALAAERLVVGQDVSFTGEFSATGGVSLDGSQVGGSLRFDHAELTGMDDRSALSAQYVVVKEDLSCREFVATGAVDLFYAQVGAKFEVSAAKLTNQESYYSLFATGLNVARDARFGRRLVATGGIYLDSAHVGGSLEFEDAQLTRSGDTGKALSAYGLNVVKEMALGEGFEATGLVDLNAAHIGLLALTDAVLRTQGLGSDEGTALRAVALTADMLFLPQQILVVGNIDLTMAKVRLARLGLLPAPAYLYGFSYADIVDLDPGARWWRAWLRADPGEFRSQPYRQLAAFFRGAGKDAEARRVLMAEERYRRRAAVGRPPRTWLWPVWFAAGQLRRLPGRLYGMVAGYGYAPWRAAIWLLAAVAAGAAYLERTSPARPTSNVTVNSALLALDSITPTSPFGLRQQADLNGSAAVVAVALQIVGYGLALAVLPALSRVLSRPEP